MHQTEPFEAFYGRAPRSWWEYVYGMRHIDGRSVSEEGRYNASRASFDGIVEEWCERYGPWLHALTADELREEFIAADNAMHALKEAMDRMREHKAAEED